MSPKNHSTSFLKDCEEKLNRIIRKRKQIESNFDSGPSKFVKNLVENLTLENQGRVYSNVLYDVCKVKCEVCASNVRLSYMKTHVIRTHGISFKEYSQMFGNPLESMRHIYHKCAICFEDLLFDLDNIKCHITEKKHKITMREYSLKHLAKGKKMEELKIFQQTDDIIDIIWVSLNNKC